jgi:hypothetical protein
MKKTPKMLEIESRIGEIMMTYNLESIPSRKELKKLHLERIATLVQRHYGGFRRLRMGMSAPQKRRENGLLKKFDYISQELRRIMKVEGYDSLPNSTFLRSHGYGSIVQAIYSFHGGFRKLRIQLGEEQREIEKGRWQDLDFVLEETEKCLIGQGRDTLPGAWILSRLGYDGLSQAISKYHGGFPAFRKLLAERTGRSLPKEKRRVKCPSKEDLMLSLINNQSQTQIARYYDVSPSTIRNWLRKVGLNCIITQEQFQQFLKQNETARNIAVAAISLNGNGADMEELLVNLYEGRFKDPKELHSLVQDNYEEARRIISEGRTNLGHFVGDFTVSESPAIPVFIEEAVELIPKDKISGPVEDRFVRVLRHVYGPRFNDSPQETLDELAEKSAPENSRKSRGLYERLYGHYSKVMEAMR